MNVSQTFYMSLQAQIHLPSNVFDSTVEYVRQWGSNVMHRHGTASLHIPTGRGITNTVYNHIAQGGMANWWPVLDQKMWLCKVV